MFKIDSVRRVKQKKTEKRLACIEIKCSEFKERLLLLGLEYLGLSPFLPNTLVLNTFSIKKVFVHPFHWHYNEMSDFIKHEEIYQPWGREEIGDESEMVSNDIK